MFSATKFGRAQKIDNLKTGVLEHLYGCAPVFNPRYLDFARHSGFDISACNVAKGNEKGRVENGVGYVKKNFLNGLDLSNFNAVNPAARLWLDSVANVRLHGETHRRPVDLFEEEKARLRPNNPATYDIARIAEGACPNSSASRWRATTIRCRLNTWACARA